MALVEQFTDYGRIAADHLGTKCLSIPADSNVGVSAQATLSEAARRLYLPPPSANQQRAARRAHNLARLIQALNRATDRVSKVQAETGRAVEGWTPSGGAASSGFPVPPAGRATDTAQAVRQTDR